MQSHPSEGGAVWEGASDTEREQTGEASGPAPLKPARRWWPRFALALALCGVVAGVPLAALRGRDNGVTVAGRVLSLAVPQPNPPSAAGRRAQDPITLLVMGVEDAPAYAGPQLTDSLMLWALDPRSQRAAILSIPRDLWVDVPGFGRERINAALEDAGPATAELAVERYIGVPVEYYAIVNYRSFVKLIDDVGGIDVDVPRDIYDPCYPNAAENACTVYSIAQGPHHLDGAAALQFARERRSLPAQDVDRESNQQLVLMALKEALLRPKTLLHLPAIVGDLQQLVTTDLPYADLPGLAAEAVRLPKAGLANAVLGLGTEVTNYVTSDGEDVLLPDEAAIHRVAGRLFAPELALLSQAPIQVENGAPTDQPPAGYLSEILDAMGATTLPARQAETTDHATSAVYWSPGAAEGLAEPPPLAYMLAAMLHTRLETRDIPDAGAPLVVVLGQDFPRVLP